MKRTLLLLAAVFFLGAGPTPTEDPVVAVFQQQLEALRLAPHQIQVYFNGDTGRFTLAGYVSSELDRVIVETAAKQIRGVTEVQNSLIVSEPPPAPPAAAAPPVAEAPVAAAVPAATIAPAVPTLAPVATPVPATPIPGTTPGVVSLTAQIWDKIVENKLKNYDMNISAVKGQVRLLGTVASVNDKNLVEQIARSTPGVIGVENLLQAPQPLTDQDIFQRVQNALIEDQVSTKGLTYTVTDGVVTFQGTQQDHRAVDRILSITLMVSGVKEVRTEIKKIVRSPRPTPAGVTGTVPEAAPITPLPAPDDADADEWRPSPQD